MAAFAFATAISLAAAGPAAGGVVSLNLCSDELVLLVARPEQIRSVSFLSHSPEESPLWRLARRHRANDGSMLAATAVRPSLVVTMGSSGRDRARLARAVGARLIVLPYPTRLADVEASLFRIGQATGNPRRAARIVAAMRAAQRGAPNIKRDALWLDGAGRSFSPTGLGAQWLTLAGLAQRNVAGDRMTLETLIARPPALLVQSRYRARQTSSATAWLSHPAAHRVRAGRTLVTDGRRWTCMGPTLLPEILRLRERAGQ